MAGIVSEVGVLVNVGQRDWGVMAVEWGGGRSWERQKSMDASIAGRFKIQEQSSM